MRYKLYNTCMRQASLAITELFDLFFFQPATQPYDTAHQRFHLSEYFTLGKSNPLLVLTATPSKRGAAAGCMGRCPAVFQTAPRPSPGRQRVRIFMCTHSATAYRELCAVKGTLRRSALKFSGAHALRFMRCALDCPHAHSLPSVASSEPSEGLSKASAGISVHGSMNSPVSGFKRAVNRALNPFW